MLSLFDLFLFLGILFAMLMSSMPVRAGIAFCLYVNFCAMFGNLFYEGWNFWWFFAPLEIAAVFVLLIASRMMDKLEERVFFRVMAGFFAISAAIQLIFMGQVINFAAYTQAWHLISVMHVLFMLGYSDAIRNTADHIWHSVADRFGHTGIRHHKG